MYPLSNAGRYMMVLAVIGGQIYFALIIGIVHGQITLTSEESGVLNIISNNKKEKSKKISAASLIYYLLLLAGL